MASHSKAAKPIAEHRTRRGRQSHEEARAVRDICKALLSDKTYRINLLARLRDGTAGQIEGKIWDHAYGRPTERVEVTDSTSPLAWQIVVAGEAPGAPRVRAQPEIIVGEVVVGDDEDTPKEEGGGRKAGTAASGAPGTGEDFPATDRPGSFQLRLGGSEGDGA